MGTSDGVSMNCQCNQDCGCGTEMNRLNDRLGKHALVSWIFRGTLLILSAVLFMMMAKVNDRVHRLEGLAIRLQFRVQGLESEQLTLNALLAKQAGADSLRYHALEQKTIVAREAAEDATRAAEETSDNLKVFREAVAKQKH